MAALISPETSSGSKPFQQVAMKVLKIVFFPKILKATGLISSLFYFTSSEI